MKSSQIVDFSRCLLRLAVVAAVLAATFFVTATPVQSADETILEVDAVQDSNDPAYQQCTAAADDCSLRGAIIRAYTEIDPDITYTIVLDNTTYFLELDEMKAPNETGDLNVRKTLTIEGNGATIDAQGIDRVFDIAGGDVTLRNLTITGGHAPDGRDGTVDQAPGNASSGGGIYYHADKTLTLQNCTVTGNRAGKGGNGQPGADASAGQPAAAGGKGKTGGFGGGISTTFSSSLVLINTRITGNLAGNGGDGGAGGDGDADNPGASGGEGGSAGRGGGVDAGGDLQMEDCLVQDNRAGDGGAGGPGGRGGDNAADSATNGGIGGKGGAGGNGGGIYGNANYIHHRTLVADNAAGVGGAGGTGGDGGNSQDANGGNGGNGGDGGWGSAGGGIYLGNVSDLVNSTIAHNQAGSPGVGGTRGNGGSGDNPGENGNDGELSLVAAQGGGIFSNGGTEGDPVRLLFVTIVGNRADQGGGIRNAGRLIIKNSILVNNVLPNGTINDCNHNNLTYSVTSKGFNLYTNFWNCIKDPDTDIDLLTATEAGLLDLADNGGPTATIALADDSPAVDAGLCEGFPAITERPALDTPDTDQRGSPRPIGETCDIGAYENEPPAGPFVFLPMVIR